MVPESSDVLCLRHDTIMFFFNMREITPLLHWNYTTLNSDRVDVVTSIIHIARVSQLLHYVYEVVCVHVRGSAL